MDWFSVTVSCTALMADLAADVLMSVGAKGVAMVDEVGERVAIGRIQETAQPITLPDDLSPSRPVSVTGHFSRLGFQDSRVVESVSRMMAERASILTNEGIDAGGYSVDTALHKEADWENAWKAGFSRVRVGRRLVVAPPWDLPETEEEGEAVLVIDPGMAFGTGTHPTTRMCLAFLERFVAPGNIVADVGTGSGILAIAAVKLGASSATGWDFDPVAIDASKKNAALNGISEQLDLFLQESSDSSGESGAEPPDYGEKVQSLTGKCDIVVANIAADTLVHIADMLKQITKPGGLVVLSGIVAAKEKRCLNSFRARRFRLVDRMREGEWVALCLKIGEH